MIDTLWAVIARGRGDVQKVRGRFLATACLALGTTHLIKACQVGTDSIHGIWRWTLAGAASGVVGAGALLVLMHAYKRVWS